MDDKIKNNQKLLENENNQILKRFQTTFSEKADKNKKKEQKSQIINSIYFNIENKKYIPLNILRYSFFPPIIILLIIFVCLIPIFIQTILFIDNTNKLLIVHKYIFGLLIKSSINIIDIKCFISDCKIDEDLNYNDIVNNDLIKEALQGIGLYNKINTFYSDKFMLNACGAAIDSEKEPEKYKNCLNDNFILSSNNTDNLIKLIDEFVHNIKKEYEIEKKIPIYNASNYNKKKLFNSTDFRNVEYIYFNYIYSVSDIFEDIANNNFKYFLDSINYAISFTIIYIGIVSILYCLIFWNVLSKKLIQYLSISRCVMKIIPTSVIINTQELETWIENKY